MTTIAIPGIQILRHVTDGGCAEVYEAEDAETGRHVAVKILHPRHRGNKTEHKRLLSEGALGMQVRHHLHLVQIMRVGAVGELAYVVEEWIPGLSLREMVRQKKLPHELNLLKLAGALARALKHLHDAKIVHKDVKPDNVLWPNPDGIKLIDLGFAEKIGGFGLTSLFGRSLEGSPAYLAPELIRTKKPSFQTDMYALGCTLYEAATGHVPYPGSSEQELLAKQVDMGAMPESIAAVNKNISLPTQKLIWTALEKNPENRYPTMDQFLMELQRHPLLGGAGGSNTRLPIAWNR
jgi:serine/threonine protein kinase